MTVSDKESTECKIWIHALLGVLFPFTTSLARCAVPGPVEDPATFFGEESVADRGGIVWDEIGRGEGDGVDRSSALLVQDLSHHLGLFLDWQPTFSSLHPYPAPPAFPVPTTASNLSF